jgi:hypothetical protein
LHRRRIIVRTKRWTPPKVPRLKLLRSNPFRKSFIIGGKNPNTLPDDDNLAPLANSRTRLVKYDPDNDDLPDHILDRLATAREKALEKYREICYNSDTQALNTVSVRVL